MMHKIVMLFLTACFAFTGQAALAENSLNLDAGYASFFIPSEATTYVEVYYSLYRHQLGFVASDNDSSAYAGVLVTATIFDNEGETVDSASTYFLTRVSNGAEQEDKAIRLFDYLPIKMNPGNYRVDLIAIDGVSKNTGKTSMLVTVPDYNGNMLFSSDLELAYDIHDVPDNSAAAESRLAKEGRIVIPNPTGVYQPGVDSVISVYSELYGLDAAFPESEQFSVKYRIKDLNGNGVYDYVEMHYQKPGNSAILANKLDISSIAPGKYFLSLEVKDGEGVSRTVATRHFALVEPEGVEAAPSETDVQLMVNIAWYHLSEAEKIRVGDLSPAGKVNLIQQFWRDRDDDPSTPENPVYDEAVKRFKYANDNFSTSVDKSDGWHTDRGRVYITYGPYDERQEEVMAGKSYPYVKWDYYRLEGGCVFVFVNDFVAGATDYRLVHSTHPREKYDPKWQVILEEDSDQGTKWRDPGDEDF